MKITLSFILSVIACSCFGQTFIKGPAFIGAASFQGTPITTSYTPTNLPNAVSISWWQASKYVTNIDSYTLPDNTGMYSLTNLGGDTSFLYRYPVPGGTLNGSNVLNMWNPINPPGQPGRLESVNYTSAQPHTVCLVLKCTNPNADNLYLFDSANGTYRNALYGGGGGAVNPKSMFALTGGQAFSWDIQTNTWLLLEVCFNGASSSVYTNGVLSGSGDAGTDHCGGFYMNGNFNGVNGSSWLFAEGMTYGSAFTAADRNWHSNYVRTAYGAGNVVP